jgi:hypothetical protein
MPILLIKEILPKCFGTLELEKTNVPAIPNNPVIDKDSVYAQITHQQRSNEMRSLLLFFRSCFPVKPVAV